MAVVQPNMQAHEELAALFSRNLTLEQQVAPTPQPAPAPAPAGKEESKIVYISQHYNHSAHVARNDARPPRPASEPPQAEHAAVEAVLRNHGVDTSGLSSAQLELFKTVDDPQRLHLINLWRTCPPTNSHNNPTLAWSATTVAQEETLAQIRWDELVQQQLLFEAEMEAESELQKRVAAAAVDSTIMSLDGTPLTPIQGGDGRWLGAVAADAQHYMEPYMAAGYEELARREYEESARRALFAEVEATSKEYSTGVTTHPFAPTTTTTTSTVSATGQHNAANTGALPQTISFSPGHADPVYQTTNAGIDDWRARREAAMADEYGRFMAMRGDMDMS